MIVQEINVLMVVPNLRVSNGIASFAISYYRKLSHNKIHMDFVTFRNAESPYIREIEDNGDKVFVLPSILKSPIDYLKICRSIMATKHYDLIHDNSFVASIPMMLIAKKYINTRIVHSHSSRFGENTFKEKRNSLFAPILIALATDYAACSKLAANALFGNAEYSYIPNIISEKRVLFSDEKRSNIRSEMNVSSKIVIGTIGRVCSAKNPFFALDIIKEVIYRNSNVEYWWIGSGPMDKGMKEGVVTRGLEEHVRLLGSRDDIPNLLLAMDIFFLPSLFEGLPIAGIEAQAAGLPSIISSSVTEELVFTDLVKFVSLDAPIEQWVDAIEEQITQIPNRRSHIDDLRNSPFSDIYAGKNLTNYYTSLIKK